jgi:hypothetical protein
MSFFKTYGYPQKMSKPKKRPPKQLHTIYETWLYQKEQPTRKELREDIKWLRLKFLRQNMARAESRGHMSQDIIVTLDEVYKIGEKQKWKCALTGLPLEFTRGGTMWGGKWCNPNSCTIDRIDSSKGYVIGNIQLVIWSVNCTKRDMPNGEFIKLAKLVAKNN